MTTRKARSAAEAPPIEPPQPVANPTRGEHELMLAGTTFRLRPSKAAVRAIEQKLSLSTLELVRIGNGGGFRLDQLGVITAQLAHAGAEDELTRMISAERFEDMIYEEGLAGPTARLTLCLLDAATGGRTASGNARAAAA